MVHDPMMEMYLFETGQLVNRLEQLVMASESKQDISDEIDEIFRIMHTVKGNSMMMLLEDIGKVGHRIEDLFDYLKEVTLSEEDLLKVLDFNFDAIDFFKVELDKLENGLSADGSSEALVKEIEGFLEELKGGKVTFEENEDQKYFISPSQAAPVAEGDQFFSARLFFEADAQMENVRAFSIAHNLKDITEELIIIPEDIVENEGTCKTIQEEGFLLVGKSSETQNVVDDFFKELPYIDHVELDYLEEEAYIETIKSLTGLEEEVVIEEEVEKPVVIREEVQQVKQNFISVDVQKVDLLMDLVGELVVAESMVINNQDLQDLQLSNFDKASRQLRLVINEMQDVVMSVRMVPLTMTFQKMSRIVRDMKKKIGKDVRLILEGETTEVDKNVIEKIGDPLMHIIRNAMDHGIEDEKKRLSIGKDRNGTIELSARHVGGNVVIKVKDDGRGLDKEQIYEKAFEKGLLEEPIEAYTDQEIYAMIMNAGFSTKTEVSEFSGRGVGMDVVNKNIDALGGSIVIESEQGKGTEISILIPLTLAIVDGMMMRVGKSIFTLPIMSIKESFIADQHDIIKDPEGQEMIMVRGVCHPLIRLTEYYEIEGDQHNNQGIFVMIEHDGQQVLLLADELVGEQQVVVKSLSKYIKRISGVSGFALLGDGSISMILDPSGFMMVRG
ncbi:chemotaxis protein CheA [Acidaminobacter sp. JC074]|uniref:chemotaxis protein CheA n=1 Tax=Acidaminobacter sp. JC074 TaxID=2530199 RepID=UPI001F0DA55D|nr:chemotaxis protein CheA [Acidaminobacter sp. JC074]MCH4890412.1 chemotaxis protein CheA [Acidaminobacter sp. JC074]